MQNMPLAKAVLICRFSGYQEGNVIPVFSACHGLLVIHFNLEA